MAQSLAYSVSRGRYSQSQNGETSAQSKAPPSAQKPYNPQDASKDSEVQQAIAQSKPPDLHS
jgi:hypothetical protein